MKYTRNIFAVSIMALMAVSTARAEIVATTLLDERLGTPGTLATVASTGSYADLKNKPTIPTKTSDLTNDSNFATTTAVNAKVSTNQGTTNAGKGLVVNSAGNLELQDIATQAELNTVSGKIPTNTNQLTNGAGFITSAAISGKEDSTNKVTDTAGYNTDITSTSKYPSMAVANEMAKSAASSAVSSKVNTNQGTNQANKVLTTNAQGVVVPGTVSSAMITDGTITTTDISATAGITKAQLATAVQTSLGKADSALQSVPVATATTLGGVKAGSNITIATDGTISTHAPVTPGNATVTITQGGATKGTFKLNQTGDVTVALTDADTKYTLPAATTTALGGVKSGGNITVTTDGAVTVNQAAKATTADSATTATSATKATQDGNGANIVNTYATKAQLNALNSTSTGSGAVVTAVSQTNGKVSVTKGNVQIPVGGASGTTYATIWVE